MNGEDYVMNYTDFCIIFHYLYTYIVQSTAIVLDSLIYLNHSIVFIEFFFFYQIRQVHIAGHIHAT